MTYTSEDGSAPCDPLGSVSWEVSAHVRTVAPTFCDLFGSNAYMVRKYVRFDYPIDPLRTNVTKEWLFHPSGPSNQDDLVQLEREIGESDFLRPYLGGYPLLHSITRVERVLDWLRGTKNPRVFRQWSMHGDLTEADDFLVEGVVAFITAACSGVPASDITFIPSQQGKKTAEFRIDALNATVEVKHLMKVPQGERDERWLHAFKRQHLLKVKKIRRPEEEVNSQLLTGLENTTSVTAEELPWQKSVGNIKETIKKADEQLASAQTACKVIVLYSDDPHTLTRSEDSPDQGIPTENRIEEAASSAQLQHANVLVVLGSPCGFPVASGHAWKAYPVGSITKVVDSLFRCLPPLQTWDVRPAAIGVKVDLAPGEQRKTTLS